jgi:hypothetical protein
MGYAVNSKRNGDILHVILPDCPTARRVNGSRGILHPRSMQVRACEQSCVLEVLGRPTASKL